MATKKNKPEAALWTVEECTRLVPNAHGKKEGRVFATLFANGLPVHTLQGVTARESLQAFADRRNERGCPEPKEVPRTIADGWRQSRHSHKV